MALVTEATAVALDPVHRVNLAADLAGGPRTMVVKISRAVRAVIEVAFRGPRSDHAVMAVDSGEGMYVNLVLVALFRLFGVRTVLQHHTSFYLTEPRRTMRLMHRIGGPNLIDGMLCADARDTFARTYDRPPESVTVIGNAFTIDAPALGARSSRPVTVGHLANLSVAKGIEDVCRLAVELPDVQFVVAGPAIDEVAEQRRAELAGMDNVELRGALNGAEVDQFHNDVDIFLLPSENEAMPLVVWEALAHGSVVVGYAVGCVPSMGPGELVRVVDGYDALRDTLVGTVTDLSSRDDDAWVVGRQAAHDHFAARRADALAQLRSLVAEVQQP